MSEMLNLSGVHSDGKAELQIGIRDSSFIIRRSGSTIEIYDVKTNTLLWNSLSSHSDAVFNFKGTYKSFVKLQEAISSGLITPNNGDSYMIINAGGHDYNGKEINMNDIIAYSDSNWFNITNTMGITESTLNSILENYAKKATTLKEYGITDAYTKSEIDSMNIGVFHYKGVIETYSNLPQSPSTGDVYNIRTAGGEDVSGVPIKAGDNVCWNGSGWDNLSGIVDLSAYITRTELTSTLEKYAKTENVPTITPSTSLPSEDTPGKPGDLWVVYTE